jgi:elongation of very long chain fatty acids protein 6
MNIKVPRALAKTITVLQIAQMFVGLWVGVVSLVGKGLWDNCDRPWDNILWGLGMYSSYAILFIHFFTKSYSTKKLESEKTRND